MIAALEDRLARLRAGLIGGDGQGVSLEEDMAARFLAARRLRDQRLGPGLFGDPAWDILLEAFASHLNKMPMSIADLARAVSLPESTTERWVNALDQQGWFDRSTGASGFLALADEAVLRLRAFFAELGTIVAPL